MRALIRDRTELVAQQYEYKFSPSEVFNSSSSASHVYQAEFAPGVKHSFAFAGLAREREATRSEPDAVARFNQVAPWIIYGSAWRLWETVEIGVQNVMQQREDHHSNEALSAGMIDAVSTHTVIADVPHTRNLLTRSHVAKVEASTIFSQTTDPFRLGGGAICCWK